jgi:alpha-galactosidase/6-phospho-beta-glucosidase family protein
MFELYERNTLAIVMACVVIEDIYEVCEVITVFPREELTIDRSGINHCLAIEVFIHRQGQSFV